MMRINDFIPLTTTPNLHKLTLIARNVELEVGTQRYYQFDDLVTQNFSLVVIEASIIVNDMQI
jgi:hypothetical protein